MTITTDTYFKIFKIEKISDIDFSELKRRFRILVKKYHPDHGEENSNKFILIHDAYNYLRDRMKEFMDQESPKFFDNNDLLFYGDGSIYSVKKKRWLRLKDRNGKKIIDNGKYIDK